MGIPWFGRPLPDNDQASELKKGKFMAKARPRYTALLSFIISGRSLCSGAFNFLTNKIKDLILD